MKSLLPISFLLIACSHQTIEELTDTAQACGPTPECRPLWEKVYRKEEATAKKEREDAPCPNGLVKWKDWTGARCVTREEVERALRGLHY